MMTLDADLQWYVEKHGMDFVAEIFGELDPVVSLLRCEVRGVNVIHRAARNQPRLQH